ncbi:MAG: Ig-like domain-containing protein [Chitinophagaceae bacterium]|nr:Ig-like domain-containing protein [Rubrivivax sp.]
MGKLTAAQLQWLQSLADLVGAPRSEGQDQPLERATLGPMLAAPGGPDGPAVAIVRVDPDGATMVVGSTEQYTATVELETETRLLSRSEVEWTSSDPAVSINADGMATAHSLPKTPVRITAKDIPTGSIGSTTVTVVAPAAKPPPVPAKPELQFIAIGESKGFAPQITSPLSSVMHLQSTRQFHATGVYAGYSEDMTKTAVWHAKPESVVRIDNNGLATAVGVGVATISASDPASPRISNQIHLEVPEPVLQSLELKLFTTDAYHGRGGATLYRDAQFQFRALGLFSNGKPQDVTDKMAWSTSNAKRGKIDNRGLLTAGMEAGVVTVAAKQVKGGIAASQDVFVLTDINPKSKITAENFPTPTTVPTGKDAVKATGADPAKLSASGRSQKEVPPYGVLTYWTDEGKTLIPLLDKALSLLDQARGLVPKLGEQLKRQNEAERRIEKASKSTKDLSKDISGNVSQRAKDLAEIAEAQKNHVSSTVTTLNALRADLWIAQRAARNSAQAIEAAAKHEKAAALRERAQKQAELLDALLLLLGAAIEGTVNVLSTGGAAGAIKPAYDALSALFKFVHTNPLLTEAQALEKDAKEMLKAVGVEDFRIATDKVQNITTHLADVEKNAKDYLADYVRTRHDAEEEFDRNPRSIFRFGDYVKAIALTEQTSELATQVVNASMNAERAAGQVASWYWDREPHSRKNNPVHSQMTRDASGWWQLAAVIRTQAAELRGKLQEQRAAANNTFVESKRKSAAPASH